MKHFSNETLSCCKWTFVNLLLRQEVQKLPVLIHQSFLHHWVSLSSCRIIIIPNQSVETLVCTNLLKVTLNPLPSFTARSGQPAASAFISWQINKRSSRVSLRENCPRELWQKWPFRPEADIHCFLGSGNLRQWGVTLKHHNSEEERRLWMAVLGPINRFIRNNPILLTPEQFVLLSSGYRYIFFSQKDKSLFCIVFGITALYQTSLV